jgi:paraquat-inducible protein A
MSSVFLEYFYAGLKRFVEQAKLYLDKRNKSPKIMVKAWIRGSTEISYYCPLIWFKGYQRVYIMSEKQSLRELKSRHWYIPIMILMAIGLLIAGWSLPTLKLTKVIFFTDTYSIWAGITELWKADLYFLAGLIFFFSMIFPLVKLLGLMGIWFVSLTQEARRMYLDWLELLGRWSMLDVFVVAILIVLVKSKAIVDAQAAIGIYLFAGAILLSMLTANIMNRMTGN